MLCRVTAAEAHLTWVIGWTFGFAIVDELTYRYIILLLSVEIIYFYHFIILLKFEIFMIGPKIAEAFTVQCT